MCLQMKALAALQDYRTAPCPKHFVFDLSGSFVTSLILEEWWAGAHSLSSPCNSLFSGFGGGP